MKAQCCAAHMARNTTAWLLDDASAPPVRDARASSTAAARSYMRITLQRHYNVCAAVDSHVSPPRAPLKLVVAQNLNLPQRVCEGGVDVQQLRGAVEEEGHKHVGGDRHGAANAELGGGVQAHAVERVANLDAVRSKGKQGKVRRERDSLYDVSRARGRERLTAPTSPSAAMSGLLNALRTGINACKAAKNT